MNWYRIIDMAQWPYLLQEAFKAALILFVLCACLWAGRNRVRRRSDVRYRNPACTLSLLLAIAGEVASAGGWLWPYLFARPQGWYTLRHYWGALGWLSFVAVFAALAGLFSKDRQRWLAVLLAALFAWGNMFMYSGEPALVVAECDNGCIHYRRATGVVARDGIEYVRERACMLEYARMEA